MENAHDVGSLTLPAYFVAALLVVFSAMDFVTNVWPLRPGDLAWRYGTAGLFTGFVLTPLLGWLIALGVARLADHRKVTRVLGIASIGLASVFVLAMGMFLLDALQLRGSVQEDSRSQFDVGVIKAVFKYLLVAGALGWIGWVSVRVREAGQQAGAELPPLVRPEA